MFRTWDPRTQETGRVGMRGREVMVRYLGLSFG